MRRKWGIFIATCILASGTIFGQQIGIAVNNQEVTGGHAPIFEKGTTLVPLRLISEKLGAKVQWQKTTNSVHITKGDEELELYIGTKKAVVDGKETTLNTMPRVIKGETMVPVRFILENLHVGIVWNKSTQMIEVEEARESALTSKQILTLVDSAQTSVMRFLGGYNYDHPGNEQEYGRLKETFNTLEKVQAYLEKYYTHEYYEKLMKDLSDNHNYKVVDGELYLILGDVGLQPEFEKGTIVKMKEDTDVLDMLIKAPCADEIDTYKVVVKKENDQWKVNEITYVTGVQIQ